MDCCRVAGQSGDYLPADCAHGWAFSRPVGEEKRSRRAPSVAQRVVTIMSNARSGRVLLFGAFPRSASTWRVRTMGVFPSPGRLGLRSHWCQAQPAKHWGLLDA
jgi:hypothetical protein